MIRTPLVRSMQILSLAGLALAGGQALAESQYGSGTGTITAQAKVNLSVTVPKLILLRVGSTNTTVDTVTWTSALSIPGVPTTPITGNNTNVDWSGAAPTVTTSTAANTLTVYAWTNAGAGTINCAMGAWAPLTGGPANADFTVTTTGTLPHPGANLGACASTSFPSNAVATGTWAYTLGGTPAGWVANTYTNTITYTAQGI
ncbi:hypothetical protein ABL840_36360 [Variovorax sp. NFACC27]|jgi:hypothetical protein|uniref:hypothetical protein n=1 Tax=unclassified Variovorax TaxID=663243 RepID=UPI00089AC2F1|nr:hypothetical protein [Variovorax paradoxus]SEF33885.1 hypothetical protein SAMN03159371_06812 [Variovorax sp. NFACC28]SEG96884.1 hypothetical protein SAMN03159365_06695 [Variovorax sp. NFACC29]SFD86616.1 hypothetical protein SAMN03159379_06548 [Variovorax sp. NFACC26]SFH03165.1 hypothetical protein SAMN03159447_06214 [Variovorax sp. NFACC27]